MHDELADAEEPARRELAFRLRDEVDHFRGERIPLVRTREERPLHADERDETSRMALGEPRRVLVVARQVAPAFGPRAVTRHHRPPRDVV